MNQANYIVVWWKSGAFYTLDTPDGNTLRFTRVNAEHELGSSRVLDGYQGLQPLLSMPGTHFAVPEDVLEAELGLVLP